jgi:Transglutaminase-like superfamily
MVRLAAITGCVRHPVASGQGAREALRALRGIRRELPRHGIHTRAPALRALTLPGVRGGRLALWLVRASCLERSLVMQALLAARGERHPIVVGVVRPGRQFEAHAWLAGYDPISAQAEYSVIVRVPPP